MDTAPTIYPYNASVRLPGSFRQRIDAAAAAAVDALERAGCLPDRTRGYADGRREYGGLTVRYGRKGSLRVTLTATNAGRCGC